MSAPTSVRLPVDTAPAAFWSGLAEAVAHWCGGQGAALRDTVVLLPFAQLLDPARRAFAARGSWQPRIETSETWAARLGPAPEPAPGLLCGLATLDALSAAQLLRAAGGLAEWESRDPRGFHQAVDAVVATAQALHRAAHARAPAERVAFWDAALAAAGGGSAGEPAALERGLARLAAEWARLSPAPVTDRLFDARPAALVWLDAGGSDALAAALAHAGDGPALQLVADPVEERIGAALAGGPAARLIVADGFEAEARAVAAEVLGHLAGGRRPVALVALDRSLMRRVRALLERRGVAIADETGWALSTTRAAAHLMALLDAAGLRARHDDWLLALKSWPPTAVRPAALQQLERCWRAGEPLGEAAAALLAQARAWLAPLGEPGRRPLVQWLRRLAQVLQATGLATALAADAAGRQLLEALPSPDACGSAEAAALDRERLDAAGFRSWVDRTLERASYRPLPVPHPDVVLTPLGRAILRPFGAAVIGAADEKHLLAMAGHDGLLPETAARALGLETPRIAWERERLAIVQLLRLAPLSFVRRRVDGNEPRAASLALDAIELARRRAGHAPWQEVDASLVPALVASAPVRRPAPAAAQALPARLSASTLEALRACPYRFFARSVLRLREAEELDAAVEKRDYGTWLHAVLDRFHRSRTAGADDDAALLTAAAEQVTADSALEPERLLPYRIGFDGFAPAYLAWLHEREARGLHWSEGEADRVREPAEIPGLQLQGRIDRIDRCDRGDSGAGRIELIDYKTGSAARLASQVRQPLEDTQLAFYALLMAADRDATAEFRALYLALDDRQAPKEVPHEAVADSARTMLLGLAADWRRLRAGAGLPALGEGAVCETCEARGLCRRDHWAAES